MPGSSSGSAAQRAIYVIIPITGPKAFNRYGCSEQLPSLTTIDSDTISGGRRIGSISLKVIKVARDRLGGVEKGRTPTGDALVFSSRARMLVDAVYGWSLFDSLPRAHDWIRDELAAGRVTADEVARAAVQFGNMGTIRRMGVILDRLGASKATLARLERAMKAPTAKNSRVPTRPARGTGSRRWGVERHPASAQPAMS